MGPLLSGVSVPGEARPRLTQRQSSLVLKLALLGLLAYSAWLLLLFLGQRQLIYLSSGLPTIPGVEKSVPGLRAFRIPVARGEVDAWFLPPAGPSPVGGEGANADTSSTRAGSARSERAP